MLLKLKQVADRSKEKAVQTMLSLENVPEAVDDYMAEAAACFRYGFDKACLAVCRAALEVSLKERIVCEYGECAVKESKVVDGVKKEFTKDLWVLINEARDDYNYLDIHLAKSAHQIRDWGNRAAHGPDNAKLPSKEQVEKFQATEALLQTKRIISRLFRRAAGT